MGSHVPIGRPDLCTQSHAHSLSSATLVSRTIPIPKGSSEKASGPASTLWEPAELEVKGRDAGARLLASEGDLLRCRHFGGRTLALHILQTGGFALQGA